MAADNTHYVAHARCADYVRGQVQALRVSQPDTCWRPSPDWQRVCILDIGHSCPCGWELSNGERMRWAERIDGRIAGSTDDA